MKLHHASIVLGLATASTSAYSTKPAMKRDIPYPGHHTMRGNISSIASWTYAALAWGGITASNSTSELSYVCENFNDLSERYYAAFPEPSGDMARFARDAVCGKAKEKNPSPEPLSYWNLWEMKSYLAGSFIIQSYAGNYQNSSYYAELCWFLESTLLTGLWAPCPDTEESGVDAESSFCASAGYYGKDDYSRYTTATQPPEIIHQANVLVSRLMAYVLQILLKSKTQVQYLCDNFGKYAPGIKSLGLVDDVIKDQVCGTMVVVELDVAKKGLLAAMTELFSFQLLKGGSDARFPKYLCEVLEKDGLAKVGLDGEKIVADACKAAKEIPINV